MSAASGERGPSDFASLVHRALGADFDRLHPKIQEQYGIASPSDAAYVGSGVMEQVWHGRWYVVPFLWVGALRRILFPETGTDVPFEIRNYAYRDRFGRETITWKRTFAFPGRTRAFDETFVYSGSRGTPVLYAGTHQHLAADLRSEVEDDGSLTVTTGPQRLFVGPVTIPFPRFLSGEATVRETFDDARGRFAVDVAITNAFWGCILGYRGTFDLRRIACPAGQIPADARPVRENPRE